MDWESMRARLHAVPGYGGAANKGKRKEWIAAALGYRDSKPANLFLANLFLAYSRAGAEGQLHVSRCLEELERGE